jgi:hypothetical protein
MGATDLLPGVSILIAAVILGRRLSCYYSFLHGSVLGKICVQCLGHHFNSSHISDALT